MKPIFCSLHHPTYNFEHRDKFTLNKSKACRFNSLVNWTTAAVYAHTQSIIWCYVMLAQWCF